MDDTWSDGFHKYDEESGIWEFECSLKNYEGEIGWFLKNVLAEIVEEVFMCQEHYEEDERPTEYHTVADLVGR